MTNEHWNIYDYEIDQLFAMVELLGSQNSIRHFVGRNLHNAIVESAIIHARIITDIYLGTAYQDDLKVTDLVPSFTSDRIEDLVNFYGASHDLHSPRHAVNKRFAHPSKIRGTEYDYASLLEGWIQILSELHKELVAQRSVQ